MGNKVLILGRGFIGQRVGSELKAIVSRKKISAFKDIFDLLDKFKPRIVINCIGHTGRSNVDDCELALDKTLKSNAYIPLIVAEACLRKNIKFVHISSGCIYHYNYRTDKAIGEERIPDYYNLYYSRTKIYAENVLGELSKRYNILIPRIRIPLDNRPHPRNILTKLIRYKKIIDVPNSITYIPDFIKALQHLIRVDARGIYNIVCQNGLRYSELLDAYRKFIPEFEYRKIKLKNLKLERTNLILSTWKLEQSGFKVRKVQEILEECLREYIKYL